MTKLTDFIKEKGNLKIVLTDAGRKELPDIVEMFGGIATDQMIEMINYHLCNGWETIQPHEIGALTSCPLILNDEVERDEDGNVVKVGRVYWHESYQVEDAFEVLLKEGSITLQGVASDE